MIKIDNISIPAPTDYTIGIMDISKAERNAAGKMLIERIATKRKIELVWAFLFKEELSQLYKSVAPVFFEVEYIDPEDNKKKTGTFYAGDRKAGGLDYIDGNIRYRDISVNLIER